MTCFLSSKNVINFLTSHSEAHSGPLWSSGTGMGPNAFPRICTWLLQWYTDKKHLRNCPLKETGVLEHVSFVAPLLSLPVHMEGSYRRMQQHVAAFFPFFSLNIAKYTSSSWCDNKFLPLKERMYSNWPLSVKAQVHSTDSSMSEMPSLEGNWIIYFYEVYFLNAKVIVTCVF